jgi:hypothetical protein
MLGIVFTEFLDMVEDKFSYKMVDDILTMETLPSSGIYSAVGTYSDKEMITLVSNLHLKTKIPLSDLLETFGEYLFFSMHKSYGNMLSEVKTTLDLLCSLENHIHSQVKKLYPDAEVPRFKILEKTDSRIVLKYSSERKLGDLAMGLLRGCIKHYGEKASINKELITEDGSVIIFKIDIL